MPARTFALDRGGPKRLQISWSGIWKQFTVSVDGSRVGSLETKQQLAAGGKFELPDGTILEAKLVKGTLGAELYLVRNGVPIPGSQSDPEQHLVIAVGITYFVAGTSALLGIIAVFLQPQFLVRLGLGIPSLVAGALFAVLGYLTQSRRSDGALLAAMILLGLDGVASLFLVTSAHQPPPISGLLARAFFIYFMWRGYKTLRATREG